MRRVGWRWGLAVAAITWVGVPACTGTGGDAGAGVSITDSAGVRLVRLDPTALSLPERPTTVSAVVGVRAGTELFRVTAARLLGSGRLAIGNSGTAEVLYVDAGDVVRRVGREGDGPGEFRAITSFPDVRGDTLTVYDVRLGRLTVLDADGAVVATRTLQPPSRVVDIVPLAIGDGGAVLAIQGDVRVFGQSGVHQDTAPFMVMDPTGAVDTLARWPGKQWSFGSTGRGAFRTEFGFGRSVEASGRDGRAVVGSTETLVLVVVGGRGESVMRIEGVGPARAVSDDDIARWRSRRLSSLPDNAPAALRTAIENAPYNETYPAFSGVLLDADGRTWIGEAADVVAETRRWTVLGPDGRPAFRVVLRASATPMDAAADRLVVLDESELGEEVVTVLDLGDGG